MDKSSFHPCCEEFAKQAELQPFAGGGYMYPQEQHPRTQIEYNPKHKGWDVNGCCGGGCFVLTKLRWCPWCGLKLKAPG